MSVVMLLANLDGSVGGAQRQAGLLAREIARRGERVFLVNQSPPRPQLRHRRDDGVHRVALPTLGWCPRSSFLVSFLLWAAANRRQFDLIHAHSPSAGLTAGLVGRLLGKPVVVKVTGMQAAAALAARNPGRRLRRWVLDRTTAVLVAVSTQMMQGLATAGIARDRRVLIPNGVHLTPPPGTARAATRREWLGEAVGPVVLYVGRLEDVKGVRRLLAMWSVMPGRDAATLVIVGDGSLRAELEREAATRGLGRSVQFLGSRLEVRPFYLAADVFVLPSTSEGLSNALLEAMAAGLPAVASDVGGNRDVIDDTVNGFLVDWADTTASAALVGALLDDAERRQRVGAEARRRAACFSIAAVADRYGDLYRCVASHARSHA